MNNCAITLFISYSIHLCRNWPQDTKQRRKIRKKSTKRQKDEVTRLQLAMASSKSKQRQEGNQTHPQLAMASDQRATHSRGELRRPKSPKSWRGTNPLVKKPLLAMASVPTREASWDRTGHIKAHFFFSGEITSYHIIMIPYY